jgi:hypothetical protein
MKSPFLQIYKSDRLTGFYVLEGHFFVPAIEILLAFNLKDEKNIFLKQAGLFFVLHKVTMELTCQHRREFIVIAHLLYLSKMHLCNAANFR